MRHHVLALALASAVHASSIWPQFRGPSGASITTEETPRAEFDTTKNRLWQSGIPASSPSPLCDDGKLFLVKDGGLTTPYDAPTGKLLYEKERLGVAGDYYISPTYAGGRIYLGSTSGTLLVLDAKATNKPAILTRLDLGDFLAASPAFADSKLYVRTKEKLFAFGTK